MHYIPERGSKQGVGKALEIGQREEKGMGEAMVTF